jgi:hypothetical protein
MLRTITLLTVLALTIVTGVIQGRLTNRWGVPEDVLALGRRLEELPTSFGDWELVQVSEIGEDAANVLKPYGYFGGAFQNQVTGDLVTMFVIVGPPEHLCGHTPEACFYNRHYEQIGGREVFALESSDSSGKPHEFWRVPFRRLDVDGMFVPAYYSWSDGDRWVAGEDPRFLFAGSSYVFKVQLSCNLSGSRTTEETDPCQEFLAAFVPIAAPYLVSGQRSVVRDQ